MHVEVETSTILRASYILSATLVLLLLLVQPLSSRLIAYGPRTASASTSAEREKDETTLKARQPHTAFQKLIDLIASAQVPHSWFASFYVFSVLLSLFWAVQILTKGTLLHLIADNTADSGLVQDASVMSVSQVKLVWIMMLVQGCRRLFECLAFYKPSTSTMWIGHWLLGLAFYGSMSIAVWIEGSSSVLDHTFNPLTEVALPAPTVRTFFSVLLFLMSSGVQHDCHTYLASLKTPRSTASGSTSQVALQTDSYQLPVHPAFNRLVTPHYFCECLIYLSLAIAAAPKGYWINRTISCALAFVLINLGVTACGTRAWYEMRFGRASVAGKWNMLPFIY